MLFAVILVGVIGAACVVIGYLLWKKERITLLHDYHYDQVKETDKKAFCTLSGKGMLWIGAGLLTAAVLLYLTNSAWSFLAFAVGFGIGISLLIFAGKKYNISQ